MSRVDLQFTNASCAHCARLVRRSLGKIDGVLSVDVDQISRKVIVGFDPSRVTVNSIRSMMEKTGYPTTLLSERITTFSPRPLSGRAA